MQPPAAISAGPITCLGLTFASDAERRAHFTALLAEKLKDPAFRQIEGFPIGTDEDILALSNPPYYTACPNPFMDEFVRTHGAPYNADNDDYECKPFAVDVSVGKTDALYKAHGYHTKVPHLAIVPSILHYSEPGDLVLDGFCGSGMTGVAAQYCGNPSVPYRYEIETKWQAEGLSPASWGARRVILNDLSPAATAIAANLNMSTNLDEFSIVGREILETASRRLGWMYETTHFDGTTKGRIEYTVWSEVFSCSNCGDEIVFFRDALDIESRRPKDAFTCPSCGVEHSRRSVERIFIAHYDPDILQTIHVPKRIPVMIKYEVEGKYYEKEPDVSDLDIIETISRLPLPEAVPTNVIPHMHMTHERARMDLAGVTHMHHFYMRRTAIVLGTLWDEVNRVTDSTLRNNLRFWLDSHFANLSIQNRYRPEVTFPYNPLTGVYYVAAMVSEASPFTAYRNKLERIGSAFRGYEPSSPIVCIGTGPAGNLNIPPNSVDYIFTDPPFGENIYYSDLNYLTEAWYRVFTNATQEAIVDRSRNKDLTAYQDLMKTCFTEYCRVLKPGRWMTVVFHNSRNAVWNAIQEAMLVAGFVVADVRTLDKQQGSYRQVTSTAVKQDLVISAYKPNTALEQRLQLTAGSAESAWEFVRSHLRQLPVFIGGNGITEIIVERQDHMLFDRMVAFHVQRQIAVPMSVGEFRTGLNQRFPSRDSMYFLSEQVAEYDRKRMSAKEVLQLSLIVTDESSAIQWLKQQLTRKPQTFQELHPQFMREIGGWQKHERSLELSDILEQSFLRYDGKSDVPSQIHSYLSTNYRDLRNRSKNDPDLRHEAKDRWYVPDPTKAIDLEKLRERTLLREFQEYAQSNQRQLKTYRVEAMRVGFRRAWQERDYETIVRIAEKIPLEALQEDDKLLMWYDQAMMRLGR